MCGPQSILNGRTILHTRNENGWIAPSRTQNLQRQSALRQTVADLPRQRYFGSSPPAIPALKGHSADAHFEQLSSTRFIAAKAEGGFTKT